MTPRWMLPPGIVAGALVIWVLHTSPAAAQCGVVGIGPSGMLGDVVLSGAVTINTTTGDIVDGGGLVVSGGAGGVSLFVQPGGGPWIPPTLRTYDFRTLHVAPGAVVNVIGGFGLALLAADSITVDGVLDLSGANGAAGLPNAPGAAGPGVAGGWNGGAFLSGSGCVPGNGRGQGAGAGFEGACGSLGGPGGNGSSGAGGGGGGGACGAAGGAGAAHGTLGGGGAGGNAGTPGSPGGQPLGTAGVGGGGCGAAPGASAVGVSYGDAGLSVLFGGSGGSSGGFGGLAGNGGHGVGSTLIAFGGNSGLSGGPGGGGGGGGAALLCAGVRVRVSAAGVIDASGGNGGLGGGSATSANGQAAPADPGPIGGGGGGGRSGAGGGGGGGSGGSIYVEAPDIVVTGTLDVSGGLGVLGGFGGSGGFGGVGANGGGGGGSGGDGGSGGRGGVGGNGYVFLNPTPTDVQSRAGDRFALELQRPFPNPMDGSGGRFAFALPGESRVRLIIHDVAGRRVRGLVDGSMPRGRHSVSWDGRGEAGGRVSAGTYFCRLVTERGTATRSFTLLR